MRGVQNHRRVHGESVFAEQPREQPQHELPGLQVGPVQPLRVAVQEAQQVKRSCIGDVRGADPTRRHR